MANRMITGISTAILGALISIVPNFLFFAVCPYCHSMAMKCSWAAKAEYGVGVLIVFLAILLTFVESGKIRMGISMGMGFVGILSLLISTVLIGFCDGEGSCNPNCTCSSVTLPLMMTLGILVSIISFINVFYLWRTKNT